MPNVSISFAPDRAAVSKFEARGIAPSTMSSTQWAQIAPAIREKCFFSARVNNAEVLGKMRELLGQAIDTAKRSPDKALVSREKFIGEMKDFLKSRGYAVGGTKLTDITSRKRLALIYKMNYEEAHEYAKYTRGQDPDALYMFPAQEFLRVEPRRVPRSDWRQRWQAAGGNFYGGRMIALKSSDVWKNLSRFDRPYPPFDFGSGMGIEDVDRDEAIKLGLLPKDDDEPVDEIPDFDVAAESEAVIDKIPEDMLADIVAKTPNAEIKGNKLIMRSKPRLQTFADKGLEPASEWKNSVSGIKEVFCDVDTAKKRLQEGFTVETPIGTNVDFNKEVLNHWQEAIKRASDIAGRLARMEIAEGCVRNALEIWQLPNGQQMFISIFETTNGKTKGIAVAVSKGSVVRTWFVNKIQELDKCRKGDLIYKK